MTKILNLDINISNNVFKCAGIEEIMKGIVVKELVTFNLDVSINEIKDNGITSICSVLKNQKKLRKINLKCGLNPISKKSAASICSTIIESDYVTHLTEIEFKFNKCKLEVDGASYILELITVL